ncbi:MAG: hypothetical protein ACFFBH_03040 [Promethearchaeota archaeon]
MNEENVELPDLIWSCFINWLNTLEKVGNFALIDEQNEAKN